jgi:uncharacterized SAM-binding protein YcdF (DUF218 family)
MVTLDPAVDRQVYDNPPVRNSRKRSQVMFYPISKLLTTLTLPSSLVVLVLAAGALMLSWPRWQLTGRRLVLTGLLLLPVLGISPLGNALILPLEHRAASYPLPAPTDRIDGIIILGGFEDGWVSGGRPGLAVNETAERLTEGVRLSRRYPDAKIVFTGGTGALLLSGQAAATTVGSYLADVGVAPQRIVLEAKSRNTHENAILTRDILAPKPGQRWLLVTSAYHMPRSVGVFRKAGFDIQAYPVDYRTRDAGDAVRPFDSIPDGLKRVDLAAREWAGLLVYWLTGRSDSLWPSLVR